MSGFLCLASCYMNHAYNSNKNNLLVFELYTRKVLVFYMSCFLLFSSLEIFIGSNTIMKYLIHVFVYIVILSM